jgi:uncharacterized protein (TIGR02231 family)
MEIIAKTKIEKVTIYPDRARIERAGQVELATGAHRLLISELPIGMETESVRAGGAGTAQVRILSVDTQVRYYAQTPATAVQELESAVEGLRDEIRAAADRKAGWEAQMAYLDGLREATAEFAWGLSRGRTRVDDQVALVAFFQEQDTAVRDAIRTVDQEQREKKKELDALLQQLRGLQGARPRKRFETAVEIDVLSAGEFNLTLSYVVSGASWTPLYDARLLETAAEPALGLSFQAEISQNTGEPWEGVQLAVSTARPALNQRLPELHPWRIDEFVPRPVRRMMAKAAPAKAMAMDDAPMEFGMAAPAPEPVVEAEIATATMESEGTAVTYQLAGRGDIPGDGSPHKALVSEFRWEPCLDYLAIPKHTDAVFRRVRVENGSGGALLPGPVSLFAGAEYIGKTTLAFTAAGAEIELLLGVESRLVISRELVRRDVDKKLLREQRQLRYGYEIKCENHLAETAVIELHDHFPHSGHEKIKVKLLQAAPQPREISDLNMLEWSLSLSAGQKTTIRYEFSVVHPRDMRIAGLTD